MSFKSTISLLATLFVLCILSAPVKQCYAQDDDSVPYDVDKFQSILDVSKLQIEEDSETAQDYGDFVDYDSDCFYLSTTDNGQYMTFKSEGFKNRSELRLQEEWDTSETKKLTGNVKLFYPDTADLDEFTFMQIHDAADSENDPEGYPNKPLLRLAWFRDRSDDDGNDYSDHIWAVVRNTGDTVNSDEDVNDHYPLAARPDGFFDAEISVDSNMMTMTVNGETLQLDVSYWSDLQSYFKAGVYLQGEEGEENLDYEGTVQYNTLTFE